jgi:hypothetical protein
MRFVGVGALLGGLTGCGLHQLMPEGPVITPWQRSVTMPIGVAPTVTYDGDTAPTCPVPPVLAWGAAYDLDLVLVDAAGPWDMHEYARLATPSGPVWLAKDARMGTLEQTVVADLPEIASWLPELPVARRRSAIRVDDRSSATRLDLQLSYTNIDGHAVVAHYVGAPPTQPQPRRNGSTMGHSRGSLLAVLDLSHRAFGAGTITIDGARVPAYKLAGLLPFRAALVQTQTGVATGRFALRPDGDGCVTTWASGAVSPWTITEEPGRLRLTQASPIRTLVHEFITDQDGNAAWSSSTVLQYGRATPVGHIEVSPALPDLRRHFEGRHRSRYVIDANGQAGHATGALEAWWEADGPRVALLPDAPWWTADRPMLTTVRLHDTEASVEITRTPTRAPTGRGGRGESGYQE